MHHFLPITGLTHAHIPNVTDATQDVLCNGLFESLFSTSSWIQLVVGF